MRKRYDHMTPQEQRYYDRVDLLILRCLDRGWSYRRISKWVGVTAQRISKVKKECI